MLIDISLHTLHPQRVPAAVIVFVAHSASIFDRKDTEPEVTSLCHKVPSNCILGVIGETGRVFIPTDRQPFVMTTLVIPRCRVNGCKKPDDFTENAIRSIFTNDDYRCRLYSDLDLP